jgi:hypothetical protein
MKTNSRRYRRHRNPETADKKEGPFFSPTSTAIQTKETAFFQPKLTVGEPGDRHEKEADKVAEQVVSRPSAADTAVQRKEISAVQAMPEKKEDEKQVQKKGADEKKEEEKPVQKKEDKGKEEEPLQKKDTPDKKEEEKPVQKKEEPEKKLPPPEEKEEKKKPDIMAKEHNNGSTKEGSDQLAQQLKEQRNNGRPLAPEVKREMSHAIGADFDGVRIHTGDKAAAMSEEIGAQAFTHGNDVYFNSGKYDAESAAGKRLLAHELTHVVQQGAAPAIEGKHATPAATRSTPGVQREISTPLPEGVEPNKKTKIAKFPIGDFTVVVKPDRKAKKADKIAPDRAETRGYISVSFHPKYNKKKQMESVTISKKLTIQTVYGKKVTSSSSSAYGRGAIKSDIDAGHGTLGFHEGNHGIDFMDYVKSHPFPEIVIDTPISKKEFNALKKEWKTEFQAYVDDMNATTKAKTDDVTDPVPATP